MDMKMVTKTALMMRAEVRANGPDSALRNVVAFFADALLTGEGTEETIVVDHDRDMETTEITHPDLPGWELQLICQHGRWAHPAEVRLGGVLFAQKWAEDPEWNLDRYV